MATWHTIDTARNEWLGAPINDSVLQNLLDVARAEVIAYAPAITTEIHLEDGIVSNVDEDYVPDSYRWAHLQHARNIWNAQTTNPAGSFGSEEGGFVLNAFPMDWAIKQRLRPTTLFGGGVG